jgi:hypothetical protein
MRSPEKIKVELKIMLIYHIQDVIPDESAFLSSSIIGVILLQSLRDMSCNNPRLI